MKTAVNRRQSLSAAKAVWGNGVRLVAGFVLVAAASCGQMQREGQASSFLIINALEAAPGAKPEEFGGTLLSDVITTKEGQTSTFNDVGRVRLSLGLKDPGSPTAPAAPSQANFITIDRYHVRYIRADGRNTTGVDVPYAFDSALTLTVSGEAEGAFTIVRNIAKLEAPLAALQTNGVILSTIAEVTFYGHDQTGREVSATGKIGIDFANFADPKS
jgi:hypothetical protein